jgi:hypothetical protein
MRFGRFRDRAAPGVQHRETGRTFPADEVVWGIVVRPGFDELYDPFYHRGTTQHAYLEGNDAVALCGFRPPRTGPRARRRSRLGLPSPGIHPMCGMCARKVVAPRPRVAVPIGPARPSVAVPVATRPTVGAVSAFGQQPATGTAGRAAAPIGGASAMNGSGAPALHRPAQPPRGTAPGRSPWVRRVGSASAATASHGLLNRGVHADLEG